MPVPEMIWLAADSPSPSPGAAGEAAQEFVAETARTIRNPFEVVQDIASGAVEYFQENYALIAWRVLLIIFAVLLARFLLWGISKLTRRAIDKNIDPDGKRKNPRLESTLTLLKSLSRYLIFVIAALAVLQIWLPNARIITGVFGAFSVGAVAIGFGTQSLIKDMVSGLFITFENQFNVGDYIRTEEHEGTVEAMALRVTYLRNSRGQQIIVPNGSIQRVTNFARGGQQANIIVPTPYDVDTRYVIGVIEGAIAAWAKKNEDIMLESPKVLGVSNYGASSVDINVVCNTQSMKAWDAERGMRLAIKEAFDAAGISFPYPQLDVHTETGDGEPKDMAPSPGEARRAAAKGRAPASAKVERPLWQ